MEGRRDAGRRKGKEGQERRETRWVELTTKLRTKKSEKLKIHRE